MGWDKKKQGKINEEKKKEREKGKRGGECVKRGQTVKDRAKTGGVGMEIISIGLTDVANMEDRG